MLAKKESSLPIAPKQSEIIYQVDGSLCQDFASIETKVMMK
jgi:hypothetical protein